MAFNRQLLSRAALLFSFIFITVVGAFAQDVSSIDFETLRASELSDQQIERLWERAQSQGYSISELEQMALARGMQPSQVSALVRRLRDLRMQGSQDNWQQQSGQQLRTLTTEIDEMPQDTAWQ